MERASVVFAPKRFGDERCHLISRINNSWLANARSNPAEGFGGFRIASAKARCPASVSRMTLASSIVRFAASLAVLTTIR
jgi:hypothetical protein